MAEEYWDMDGAIPRGEVSPAAQLDWPIDFNPWLSGATITDINWTIPTGLTLVQESLAAGIATVILTGFVLGKSYLITCEVIDNRTPARKDTRRFRLNCVLR
jgi:hypothetical protein